MKAIKLPNRLNSSLIPAARKLMYYLWKLILNVLWKKIFHSIHFIAHLSCESLNVNTFYVDSTHSINSTYFMIKLLLWQFPVSILSETLENVWTFRCVEIAYIEKYKEENLWFCCWNSLKKFQRNSILLTKNAGFWKLFRRLRILYLKRNLMFH